MRQSVESQQIETAQQTKCHPETQYKVKSEQRRRSRKDQFASPEKLERGRQFEKSHHHFDRIQPSTTFGHCLEQCRKQRKYKKRSGERDRKCQPSKDGMPNRPRRASRCTAKTTQERRHARETDDRERQSHEYGANGAAFSFTLRRESRQKRWQLDFIHSEQA